LLVYFIKCLLSAPFPSLDPSPKVLEAYEMEKNNIISFIQFKFRKFTHREEFVHTFGDSELEKAMDNLLKLDAEELFKVMIQDESSDYFLSIFWFICGRKLRAGMMFYRTNTLYSLEFPKSKMNSTSIKQIFLGFRCFVSNAFLNIRAQFSSDSRSKEFLELAQVFWYSKLDRMGRKVLLSNWQLKEERIQTERLFSFLCSFPADDIKEQTILTYEELRRAIKKVGMRKEGKNVIERFFYLVLHLLDQLEKLPPSESLKDLEWLNSQTPEFLAYFILFVDFLFNGYKKIPSFVFLRRNSETLLTNVRNSSKYYWSWRKLFSNRIIGEFYYSDDEKDSDDLDEEIEGFRLFRSITRQVWGKEKPF
jgi:hypothetical protein